MEVGVGVGALAHSPARLSAEPSQAALMATAITGRQLTTTLIPIHITAIMRRLITRRIMDTPPMARATMRGHTESTADITGAGITLIGERTKRPAVAQEAAPRSKHLTKLRSRALAIVLYESR